MSKIEFYTDRAGEHRWRFRADNGRILADSGEGYKNLADARRGALIVTSSANSLDFRADLALEGLKGHYGEPGGSQ